MLTRYNFGAARDPEMLHKIYNAEPVAPIIEIPRRVSINKKEIKVCLTNEQRQVENLRFE